MTALQRRLEGCILRHGEDFTLDGSVERGVFSNASAGVMRQYITQAELDAITPPFWTVVVPSDSPAAIGDAVVWNGLNMVVRRVVAARWQATVVAHLLVLD